MSSAPRVVFPDPGLSSEQARDARARALRFALDCYFEKQAGVGSRPRKLRRVDEVLEAAR